VHIEEAGARKQAQASQRSVLDGDLLGPLHGVPLTIKSCIDVTMAVRSRSLLRKRLARTRRRVGAATPKSRSNHAGQHKHTRILMAYETDNRISAKRHPWNTEYSSGGSAVAGCCHCFCCSAGGVGSDAAVRFASSSLLRHLRT